MSLNFIVREHGLHLDFTHDAVDNLIELKKTTVVVSTVSFAGIDFLEGNL